MAGWLVRARSAYCCLCLIVSECSCFIGTNRRLFSTVGKVFCTNWLHVNLLCLSCRALYHGEVSYTATRYLLNMYTCMYMCMYTYIHACICACIHTYMHVYVHVSIHTCMYRIGMYRTVDCVHEISVYRYCSKIVYRDTTIQNDLTNKPH